MDERFINAFVAPLTNVLATMAMIETRVLPAQGRTDHETRGEITGLIDLVGDQAKGSLALSFDTRVVVEVMQRLFGEVPDAGGEAVGDMVGEITNMVTGGAKIILGEMGLEFRMSVPKVIAGIEREVPWVASGDIVEIPFDTEHGRIYLALSFDFSH